MAEPARDPALAFGQAGEIPLEVRPAILEPAERPIYPGPVAMNDPGERLPEPAPWTDRLGLMLTVAWPIQCGVGLVVMG